MQPVLETYTGPFRCSWCGGERDRLTIWRHPSGKILTLCFHGCQFFPEPYRATGLEDDQWVRVDPWRAKRAQPRLRGSRELREMGRDHEQ